MSHTYVFGFAHASFRAVAFERNFVHELIHERNSAAVTGIEILGSQRIRDGAGDESLARIAHHDHYIRRFSAGYAPLHVLAGIVVATMGDGIGERFAQGHSTSYSLPSLHFISRTICIAPSTTPEIASGLAGIVTSNLHAEHAGSSRSKAARARGPTSSTMVRSRSLGLRLCWESEIANSLKVLCWAAQAGH